MDNRKNKSNETTLKLTVQSLSIDLTSLKILTSIVPEKTVRQIIMLTSKRRGGQEWRTNRKIRAMS